MATFKARFATREEIILLFSASAFPVHIWSIVVLLREIPALILRVNSLELLGVIAYTQSFALLDTLAALAVLLSLGLVLPRAWFGERLVAQGTMFALITGVWAMSLQPQGIAIYQWHLAPLLASLGAAYVLVQRSESFARTVVGFTQRLTVLASLYLIIDLLSLIVVAYRNLL